MTGKKGIRKADAKGTKSLLSFFQRQPKQSQASTATQSAITSAIPPPAKEFHLRALHSMNANSSDEVSGYRI